MFDTSQKEGFFVRLSNLFPNRKLKKEQLVQLRHMLHKAVSDGVVTDQEIKDIDSFVNNTDLTMEEYYEVKNSILNEVLASVCSDRRVSPEEEKQLKQIATQLGFHGASLQLIDQHINFFRLMDFIETCPLELLPTTTADGLVLQSGEFVYSSIPAALLEERVVKREFVGGSHGVSIPIAKGLRYRVGQSRGQLVSQTGIVPVASGKFFVTNKRLIFSGDRKSVNATYNKVLDINMFSDGLRLSLTSRQKPVYIQFATNESAELTAVYISRMLNG